VVGTDNVIYLDILFIVNFIADYFTVKLTAAVLHREIRKKRFLISAIAGAICSLWVLVPNPPAIADAAVKLVSTVAMSITAFGADKLTKCITNSLCLFVISVLFAGAVIFAKQACHSNSADVINGVVYLNISPVLLIVSMGIVYLVCTAVQIFSGGDEQNRGIIDIEIICGKNKIKTKAIYDSGNRLKESLTGKSVVIVKRKYACNILGKNAENLLNRFDIEGISALTEYHSGIFVVPFHSIGSEGLLPAFPVDGIIASKKMKRDILIAFDPLESLPETAGAIIGNDCL